MELMYIAGVDRSVDESEWRPFVESQGFGHLVAPGMGLDYPVVVPTQFVFEGQEVIFHLAGPNPALAALEDNPKALISIAGDWAFVPSAWKAIGDEDPAMGIPTTYYAAVQLLGRATVVSDPAAVSEVLRRQLGAIQPDIPIADPEQAHQSRLRSIRAVVLTVDEVRAKFKYGGNVDEAHRLAVIERLRERNGPGDLAAAAHTVRRMASPGDRR
jgi:transcriptional regulator